MGQVYVCNIPLNKINRNKLMKHKACLESKNLSNIDKAELIKDLKDLIAISQSLSIEELAEREFSSLSGKMSEIYWKRQANNF